MATGPIAVLGNSDPDVQDNDNNNNNNNNKFILIWRIKHTSLCTLQTNC